MNKIHAGGSAFPYVVYSANPPGSPLGFGSRSQDGMTLRDYFAAKAMQGLLSASYRTYANYDGPEKLARDAFNLSDAMLAARGAE